MNNTNAQNTQQAAGDSGTGYQSSTATILEQLRQERQRVEEDLASLRKERAAFEELRAREILGGQTTAGSQPPKKKELTPVEYAKLALKGKIE